MANTYTQIHIHSVFAVKYRMRLIQNKWKDELYKYITGIIQNHKHKLLIINGMADHVHVLFGMRPTQSLSDLMQDIKGNSSLWINDRKLVRGHFEWQEGYGAFSYKKSDVPDVFDYILNQESHHYRKTFLDEYKELLNEFDVDFADAYIFKEPI